MSWLTLITSGIVLGTLILLLHLVKKADERDGFKKQAEDQEAANRRLEERANKNWDRELDHEKRMEEIPKNSLDPESVGRVLSTYPPELSEAAPPRPRKG